MPVFHLPHHLAYTPRLFFHPPPHPPLLPGRPEPPDAQHPPNEPDPAWLTIHSSVLSAVSITQLLLCKPPRCPWVAAIASASSAGWNTSTVRSETTVKARRYSAWNQDVTESSRGHWSTSSWIRIHHSGASGAVAVSLRLTIVHRYRKLLNEAFVSDTATLRWCPHPGCENVIECSQAPQRLLNQIVPTVHCNCGKDLCFG